MSKTLLIFICLLLSPAVFLFITLDAQVDSPEIKLVNFPGILRFRNLDFKLIKGPHYWLYYRSSASHARKSLIALEQFYNSEYNKYFKQDTVNKIKIVIFKNQGEYKYITKAPDNQQAHYDPKRSLVFSWYKPNPGYLFHESVHAWLAMNGHNSSSLWFNEGFASYYESPVKGTHDRWHFNRCNFRMRKLSGNWTSLSIFMRRIDLPDIHSKAQARLVFLYLAEQGLVKEFVHLYLENAFRQIDGITAMEEVTGKKLPQIEKELIRMKKKYIKTNKCLHTL